MINFNEDDVRNADKNVPLDVPKTKLHPQTGSYTPDQISLFYATEY